MAAPEIYLELLKCTSNAKCHPAIHSKELLLRLLRPDSTPGVRFGKAVTVDSIAIFDTLLEPAARTAASLPSQLLKRGAIADQTH